MDANRTEHTYPRTSDPVAGIGTTISSVTTDTISLNVGISTIVNHSITTATYNASSGIMTVTTSAANGFAVGRDVIFTGLGFTCSIDAGITTHYYPRGGDPAYNTSISIASTTATTLTVDVGYESPADPV